jgi:hypothetical protein
MKFLSAVTNLKYLNLQQHIAKASIGPSALLIRHRSIIDTIERKKSTNQALFIMTFLSWTL